MHTFVANFLRYAISKNYLNWVIFSQVFAKVKRVTFFETQCISPPTYYVGPPNGTYNSSSDREVQASRPIIRLTFISRVHRHTRRLRGGLGVIAPLVKSFATIPLQHTCDETAISAENSSETEVAL